MRVCIIGTGYVGLVSGACLADAGHEVSCVDIDAERVDQVNRGTTPIHEDGLDDVLLRNAGDRLRATTDLRAAFLDADVTLICVGTPFDGAHIDLSYVLAAASELGDLLKERQDYCVIAVKSTVVPGTTIGPVRSTLENASGKAAGRDFGLGMNPEFLAEGSAVRDFMQPDRIVVGGIDARSTDHLAALYEAFPQVPVIRTNPTTAEMIKYASNALLATLISFSNEIADLCEAMPDLDVADVFTGVHGMKHLNWQNPNGERHTVSAASFLWAGCGFGGSCFPKDVKALVAHGEALGQPAPLLRTVVDINRARPQKLLHHLRAHHETLKGLRVTVLGLAFKPGTDDVRESPALALVRALIESGATVTCHDPVAIDSFRAALDTSAGDSPALSFEASLDQALAEAQAVMLVTSWPEYAGLPAKITAMNPQPVLIDGRRFVPKSAVTRYAGIGLQPMA